MPHHTPLIGMIVAGIVLAFILGALANRLRISPLMGYLLAGVLVGPYTPGYVADQSLANELAEIGVILLMFGVGMHFSLKDLLSVKAIAVPGAVVQIAIATLLGMGLAASLGWSIGAGIVFGLALSVASTVVLLRALQERHLIETERGRIAVGWLIVEDLAMVLALVLLPALSGLLRDGADVAAPGAVQIAAALAITLGKVAAFVALMLLVGRRVIPWVLHYVAHTGSRELFRLAVLAIALGVAFGAAELFDVSFALGAFFAGMVLAESELSHQAANETLPLRDAFAVLFFVSVGMLFDPAIILREPLPIIAVLLIILIGKSIAAFLIVLAFRHPVGTALTISASLAQIGEFSFILANLGVALDMMPERGRDLILAGAILSIVANPLFFAAVDLLNARADRLRSSSGGVQPEVAERAFVPSTALKDHAVLIGYGRVGSAIGEALMARGEPLFVVEENESTVAGLRARGVEAHSGNAASPELLRAANLPAARRLFVAVASAFEAGQVVEQARAANPALKIVARAHLDSEVDYLRQLGADAVVMGEREIARAMLDTA
ncbi:MAG TPA: YbaL family putative K(+) efflux transporter [Alphaproteobacteria bacterium]|nr:YbaL family putative K(+) efflux transporter [Alphaproteobacteria bacterium]